MSIKINRVSIAWLMTLTWIFLCGAYFYSRWDVLSHLKPNELGDFLAGTFAPLAFLWLVIGYFQQGEELKQNTSALELQARELQRSVEQQTTLATVSLKELEHIKSQEEKRYKREKIEAQPIFQIEEIKGPTTYQTSQSHEKEYRVNLVNLGAQIWDVSINVDASDITTEKESQRPKVEHDQIYTWKPDDSVDFRLQIPFNPINQRAYKTKYNIVITFKDVLGEWENHFFHSHLDNSGNNLEIKFIDITKYL